MQAVRATVETMAAQLDWLTRLVVMVDERLTASELELGLLEQRDLCSAEHPSAEGPLENREKETRQAWTKVGSGRVDELSECN